MPEQNNANSRLSVLENQMQTITESYHSFKKQYNSDIKEIKDTLLKRPSWSVTVVISILSTVSASLIVLQLTTG